MCGNMKLCKKTKSLNELNLTLLMQIKYIDTSSVEHSQNYSLNVYFLDDANSVIGPGT